jgi:amidase
MQSDKGIPMSVSVRVQTFILSAAALCAFAAQTEPFHLQEASIDSIQNGIRSGETTCKQVVEGYIARARAYNGICAKLVTADGAKVAAVPGTVRAGAALKFPTDTVAISKLVI